MSKKLNDPGLYRRMAEPFNSPAEAQSALEKFYEEVEQARERHRIADVMIAVEMNVMTDGEETRLAAQLFRGSSVNKVPLVARVYGETRAEYESGLALLISDAKKGRR